MSDYDVIIVGAGPVGLLAALILGKYEIRTLLVEKSSEPYSYPRAIGIDDDTLQILEQSGIEKDVINKMTADPHIHYFSSSGEHHYFQPKKEDNVFCYSVLSTFNQAELEICMRKMVKNLNTVSFYTDCEFLDVERRDKYNIVKLLMNNKLLQLKAKYLLGCDGAHSKVRASCNINLNPLHNSEDWLVIDTKDSQSIRDCIDEISVSGKNKQPCASINFPHDNRRFELKISEHDKLSDSYGDTIFAEEKLMNFLQNEKPIITRSRIYRRSYCIAEQFRFKNIFLVGDAAHLVPPYGGQGMCTGMKDAANLCWKISKVIHNKADRLLLDTYHIERHAAIMHTIGFIYDLGRFLTQPNISSTMISVASYRNKKPMIKYDSSLTSQHILSGHLLPPIKQLETKMFSNWNMLIHQDEIGYIDKDILKNNFDIDLISVDRKKMNELKSLASLCAHIASELLEKNAVLLRPDMHIATVISLNDYIDELNKYLRNISV